MNEVVGHRQPGIVYSLNRIQLWAYSILGFAALQLRNVTNSAGIVWTLAYLTCPIALVHHYAFSFYSVLLVNAASYALVGSGRGNYGQRYKLRMISN